MKTRGISFSGWKAKWVAGLEVGAEFQTRRPLKPQPVRFVKSWMALGEFGWKPVTGMDSFDGPVGGPGHKAALKAYSDVMYSDNSHENRTRKCPYGQPGDRLYSREAFADLRGMGFGFPVAYRADSLVQPYSGGSLCEDGDSKRFREDFGVKWKAGMFQPKALSRGLFEIQSVRVERVQDISEEDARSEGIPPPQIHPDVYDSHHYRVRFRCAWDEMYAKAPEKQWTANPFVWVLSLEKVSKGLKEGA